MGAPAMEATKNPRVLLAASRFRYEGPMTATTERVKVVVQFAMSGEAEPYLARREFTALDPDPVFGFRFYRRGAEVVAVAGAHPRFGVDNIGSVAAAMLARSVFERFAPERVISAGTAGGFEGKGGAIGDVYLGEEVVVFHDRRIPLPGFDAMGNGHFPVECDRELAARCGLALGVVSTGDSLDCTATDLERMTAHGAAVKEMEAAAIGWVCEFYGKPLVLLKAITDLVDHQEETAAQFSRNYAVAVSRLADKLACVVDYYLAR
jgi:5'-methylthioadenosine nucleosidase